MPLTSASHQSISGHVVSFGQSPEVWGEHPGPFAPSHWHSLSTGSRLDRDVEIKSVIMGGPPVFMLPAAGFHSLPATALVPTPQLQPWHLHYCKVPHMALILAHYQILHLVTHLHLVYQFLNQ